MYIGLFVIAFGLYLLSAFLWMYCSDELPDFDQIIDHLKLVRPKISDLNNPAEQELSKYVDQVICPAYYYFALRDQIKQSMLNNASPFWTGLALHSGFAFVLVRLLLRVGFTDSILLCTALVIVACVLGSWFLSILYKKKLQLKPFSYTREKIQSQVERFDSRAFDIDDNAEVNNRLIDLHCRYLMNNQKLVTTRAVFRDIMSGIACIIYLFVFLPYFNP